MLSLAMIDNVLTICVNNRNIHIDIGHVFLLNLTFLVNIWIIFWSMFVQQVNVQVYMSPSHVFCSIWHLRSFGSMYNTHMRRGSDLPTILGMFKHDPKTRSVNDSCELLDLDPNTVQATKRLNFDQILTKYDQLMIIYVKKHQMHVKKK